MNKKLKRVPAVFMAAVLVIGVAAGAGIWLLSVEVPIEYDEPYTIEMADSEYDPEWEALEFRTETTVDYEADFGENRPTMFYHQYVRIENPRDEIINLEYEVEADDIGFTYKEGIVEPDEVDYEIEKEWGSMEDNVAVSPGETEEFTVIYTLHPEIETEATEEVTWTFSELPEGEVLYVPEEYETIQGAIDAAEGTTILVSPEYDSEDEDFPIEINKDGLTLKSTVEHEATIDGQVDISADEITFSGFRMTPEVEFGDGGGQAAILVGDGRSIISNNLFEGPGDLDDSDLPDYPDGVGVGIRGSGIGTTITGNHFEDYFFGIRDESSETLIEDNYFEGTTVGYNAFEGDERGDNLITGNEFKSNGVGVVVASADNEIAQNEFQDNTNQLQDWHGGYDLETILHENEFDNAAGLDDADHDDIEQIIHSKIQGAIDLAVEEATILVGPGTYEEDQIVIDVEGLTLQSTNGAEETTIIGAGAGDDDDLVRVNEHNVEIDGFTLESDGARHGVAVAGGTNIVIQNNEFVGFEQVAVAFDRAGGVSSVENVDIYDNVFVDGSGGVGQTEDAKGLYIAENTFEDLGLEGIGLGEGVEIVDEDGSVITESEDVSWLEENNTFVNIDEDDWVNDYR